MRVFAVLLILCLSCTVAAANDAARAAAMLERAEAALADSRTPKERLAALGRAAQAQEATLQALRGNLRTLSARRTALDERMVEDDRRLRAVLGALQRLERSPRAAALAHPGGAVSAARAGMTLAVLAPALEVEAARLRVSLDEIEEVEARRDIAVAEARASLAALQRARGEVSDLIRKNRRATQLPKALSDRLRAEGEALSRSASTLRILASALPDTVGLAAPSSGGVSFAAARGAIPSPLEGQVVRSFGAPDATSPLEGVEITAPAYAEIYAPWSGIIRFSGNYGSYGGVIILEPEPDTLIVLSGVSRFFRDAGETVLAGEPLGSLGGPLPQDEEFLISGTIPVEALAPETLYIEVRRGGKPVDPAQWFAF